MGSPSNSYLSSSPSPLFLSLSCSTVVQRQTRRGCSCGGVDRQLYRTRGLNERREKAEWSRTCNRCKNRNGCRHFTARVAQWAESIIKCTKCLVHSNFAQKTIIYRYPYVLTYFWRNHFPRKFHICGVSRELPQRAARESQILLFLTHVYDTKMYLKNCLISVSDVFFPQLSNDVVSFFEIFHFDL